MKNVLNNNKAYVTGIALSLSLLASYPVYAVTDVLTGEDNGLNLETDLSNFIVQEDEQEQIREQNKQTIEIVKNNYLSVLKLIKDKKSQQAQDKVTDLIKSEPEQSIYYNLQALLDLVNKDTAAAEKSFLKAIDLNNKNGQAFIGLAKISLDAKQLDKSKDYANQALALNPYEVKAYQVLADVTMQQQGIDAAETLLLDALSKVKGNLPAELTISQSLGKVYINKKQPKKLLQLATDLIERNQNNYAALSFLAEAQLVNKDEIAAEKTLRQIITQQPNDAKHLFLLARLLSKQENKENEILSLLDKAAKNINNPVLILSYKAAILLKQKNYKQASSVAQQVDDSNPSQSIGKILKGDVHLAQKQYPDALLNYQKAYEITPNIKVLDAILKILNQQNKTTESVTLLEKEFAKNKDNLAIQFRLAVAYQTSKQYDLSIKHYKALLAKKEDNVIVLNNLAYIYQLQNNPEAISLAKKAYQLAPKSAAIADTYGYLLLTKGDKKKGLNILKIAADLNPKLIESQLHLAEAYIVHQDKEQAKNILQKLLNDKSGSVAEQEKARVLLQSL